jgi:hypothetical protein
VVAFFCADQRDGFARFACAASAADAVNVVFGGVRQFEVDHRGQVFNVQATSGYVGSNEDTDFPALEGFKGFGTGLLALVAMDGVGRDAVALQEMREAAAAELGADEYQHLGVFFFVSNQVCQQVSLEAAGNRVHDVADGFAHHVAAGDFNQLRVLQHLVGEFLDFVREGGGEEQALPIGGQQREDAADVRDKAHVQHAVGFVEDEELDLPEGDGLLLDVVEQAARRGDDDFDAATQFLDLRIHVHAAIDAGTTQREVLGVHLDRLEHLHGQLSRGCEDQCTNLVACRAGGCAGVAGEAVEQRKGETGCLAGACLGATHHVVAGQYDGNGLALDGRGFSVTGFSNGLQQFWDESEFGKRHGCGHDLGDLQFSAVHHLNSFSLYIALDSAPREIAGDLFPVVVEVLDSQCVFDVAGAHALVDQGPAAFHFLEAPLHGQFEVENAAAAASGGDPFGHQRGDAGRLFDHVADHPLDRFFRAPGKPVGAKMLDQAGSHGGRGERAVVEGGDAQAAAGQLPAPAAGGCAQVDRLQSGPQGGLLFLGAEQAKDGFGEFEGGPARCVLRHAQARNPHWPAGALAGDADAQVGALAADEKDVQARQVW